ncbi:uncharacterized protein BX664DRAFT_385119 [Halteromyces radiatus]|uniref:uncharacterized protein n=1 Tax=Halteromyces radiatus TaxID=101107 RepID=UPI00221EFD5E|nr:uncharacterized protein BX664DRAFT_385119 [Halteromyces radiatus]KAI8093742.1 hypothetical protein BX664DRAFT_385119 [Halteromyces radiatus]
MNSFNLSMLSRRLSMVVVVSRSGGVSRWMDLVIWPKLILYWIRSSTWPSCKVNWLKPLNGMAWILAKSSSSKIMIADWLAKDGRFGRSKMCRVGAATVRMRSLWVLKEEHRRDALNKVFNTPSYRKKVRETKQRVKLIQRMVEILKLKCLCKKVYVSPICSASSLLLERDFSNNTATVMDKIKYKDGHFQDFVMHGNPSYYQRYTDMESDLVETEDKVMLNTRTQVVDYMNQNLVVESFVISSVCQNRLGTKYYKTNGNRKQECYKMVPCMKN